MLNGLVFKFLVFFLFFFVTRIEFLTLTVTSSNMCVCALYIFVFAKDGIDPDTPNFLLIVMKKMYVICLGTL